LRSAVNLQAIDRSTLERGQLLAHPGLFTPTRSLEVQLKHLANSPRPLKRRSTVRFHLGTSEVMAQLAPIGVEEIVPGQTSYAQLRLQDPVVASRGDRFVLRSYSPVVTIGGGFILDPHAERRRRSAGELSAELKVLSQGDGARVVEVLARRSRQAGISLKGLAGRSGLPAQMLADALHGLTDQGRLVNLDKDRWVHIDIFNSLCQQLVAVLTEFHRAFPLRPGMPKEELRGKLVGGGDNRLLMRLVEELSQKGEVCLEKDNIRLAGHDLTLGKEDAELKERIRSVLQKAGLAPPLVAELAEKVKVAREKVQDILNLLVSDGTLIKVKDNLFFDAWAIADLKERLRGFFQEHEEITPGQYKEITGQSRKYTVPLMEYFDRIHFTLRVGDSRRLREGN
jgi:selenocysteine-specific elongation factor